MTKTKIILLGRHGQAEEGQTSEQTDETQDKLLDESVKRIYDIGKNLRKKYFPTITFTPKNSFLWYSGKKRAKNTGKSILIGTLNLACRQKKDPPTSQQDLGNYSFDSIEMMESRFLDYEEVMFNEEFDGTDEEYIKFWSENPNATEFEGQPITPFSYMLIRGETCLDKAIKKIIYDEKDLGLLLSHMYVTEPIFMAAVNSSRDKPVTLEDIGGVFNVEEHAELEISYKKIKSFPKAQFNREGKRYDVDLRSILKERHPRR